MFSSNMEKWYAFPKEMFYTYDLFKLFYHQFDLHTQFTYLYMQERI